MRSKDLQKSFRSYKTIRTLKLPQIGFHQSKKFAILQKSLLKRTPDLKTNSKIKDNTSTYISDKTLVFGTYTTL